MSIDRSVRGRLTLLLSAVRSDTARKTAWMLLGYLCRYGFQAVAFVLLARQLGPEDFGTFAAVLAAVTFVAPVVELGAYSLAVQDVAQGVPTARSVGNTLALGAVTLPTGLLAVSAAKAFILPAASWPLVLSVAVAHFVGYRSFVLASGVHVAHGLQARNTVLQFVFGLFQLAAVVGFVLGGRGVESWGWFYLVHNILAGGIAIGWVIHSWGLPSWRREEVVSRIRPGFHLAVGLAAQTSYTELDKVMLARLGSLAATGIYTAAQRLVNIAYLPVSAFLGAIYPRFFAFGKSGLRAARRFAWRTVPMSGIIGAATAGALVLTAPLAQVILGREYADSVPALRLLAPIILLQSLYMPFADAMTGSGRQAVRTVGQVLAIGVNITANASLIPSYGWRGVVWAALLTQIFLGCYMLAGAHLCGRDGGRHVDQDRRADESRAASLEDSEVLA